MLRRELVYIIIGFIAVILIGITIGLQLVIVMNRADGTTATSPENQPLAAPNLEAAPTSTPLLPTPVPPTPTLVLPTPIPPTPIPTITSTVAPSTPAADTVAAPPDQSEPGTTGSQALQRVLNAERLTLSDDNNLLATIIHSQPYAIGFFRYEEFLQHQSQLRAVEIQTNIALMTTFAAGQETFVVVVSSDNAFVDMLTLDQVRIAFTEAILWSDINPTWPGEPIARAVSGQTSSTLDMFVSAIFGDAQSLLPVVVAVAPNTPSLTATAEPPTAIPVEPTATLIAPTVAAAQPTATEILPTATVAPTATPILPTATTAPTATATPLPLPTNTPTPQVDLTLAAISTDSTCQLITDIAERMIEKNLGLTVNQSVYPDIETLFAAFASGDQSLQRTLTFCYVDPDNRTSLLNRDSWLKTVGAGLWKNGTQRMHVVTHSSTYTFALTSQPCLLRFLQQIKFADGPMTEDDPDRWIEQNGEQIASWLVCN